jgi:thioester reductase-like protein
VKLLSPLHIKLACYEGIHKALDVDGFLVQRKEKTEYDIWNLKCQERVEVVAGILSQYNLDLVGVQVCNFGKRG